VPTALEVVPPAMELVPAIMEVTPTTMETLATVMEVVSATMEPVSAIMETATAVEVREEEAYIRLRIPVWVWTVDRIIISVVISWIGHAACQHKEN
jgi:membrane protein CcdC involved in cytochrome C biogenesis